MGKGFERVAVMVDGGFFLKRLPKLFGSCKDFDRKNAYQTGLLFKKLTRAHIQLAMIYSNILMVFTRYAQDQPKYRHD